MHYVHFTFLLTVSQDRKFLVFKIANNPMCKLIFYHFLAFNPTAILLYDKFNYWIETLQRNKKNFAKKF